MPIDYKISGIYYIKNIVTSKYYIGSSINIQKRFYQHLFLLKRNKCHSPKLQNSYNKHGKDNFEFGLVEKCTEKMLKSRERICIDLYDSVNKGYNCSNDTHCATRGMKQSQESKRKISVAQKIITSTPERKKISSEILIFYNKSQKGIPKSKEHREKISKSNIGKKSTSQTREKQRQRLLRTPINYWLGKKRSSQDKLKMSLAHIGKTGEQHPRSIPIIRTDLDGANEQLFYGCYEAAKNSSISRESVKEAIKRNTHKAGNYLFYKI